MQILMKAWTPQVRVHHQHTLAVLGKHGGKVEDGRGLALTRTATDDGHRVQLRILATEKHVRAKHAVSFSMWAVGSFFDEYSNVLRDDTEDGCLQSTLDVIDRL